MASLLRGNWQLEIRGGNLLFTTAKHQKCVGARAGPRERERGKEGVTFASDWHLGF